MKEKTRRKLLGKRLYAFYRRFRYLRFLKKIRKQRLRELKSDEIQEKESFRENIKRQRRIEKNAEKRRARELRNEAREERKAIREAIRQKVREEKRLDKQKQKLEQEELQQEQVEIRKRITEQQALEKDLLTKKKSDEKNRKKELRHKRNRLRPYLIRRRFREIHYSVKKINKSSFRRWTAWFVEVAETKTERNLFFKIALNSLSMFLLSHLVIYYLGQVITVWVAYTFDYETIVFYYKIYYNIDSSDWTSDAVKILYSIKPIAGLILGFIGLILYASNQNNTGKIKLFFLWSFVNGMVLFFGSLLMGTLLNKGFGWVISYLYYKDTGKMVFSILAIFALFISGTTIGRRLLISGNSYFNFVDSRNRKFLITSQVILPVFLGTIILSILKIPAEAYFTTQEEITYEVLKVWTILLLIIPSVVAMNSYGEIYFDEANRRPRINWIFVLLAMLFIAAVYYVLWGGLIITPPE